MSFPFVLPIVIRDQGVDYKKLIISGLVYAIPGIIISFIILKMFAVNNFVPLIYISPISLICLVTFSLARDHINPKKVAFLKAAIILLIFMLCLTP